MDKEYCKYCVDVESAKKQEVEFMKKYGYTYTWINEII